MPVLIETQRDAATGFLKGISSNYIPVLINSADAKQNSIVNVKIEKMEGHKLFGKYTTLKTGDYVMKHQT
jgi:tRNA A37 methylthiotransferase MiaB